MPLTNNHFSKKHFIAYAKTLPNIIRISEDTVFTVFERFHTDIMYHIRPLGCYITLPSSDIKLITHYIHKKYKHNITFVGEQFIRFLLSKHPLINDTSTTNLKINNDTKLKFMR